MKTSILFSALVLPPLLLAGCKGIAPPAEREARKEVSAVRQVYRPSDRRPDPSSLTAHSTLADFVSFAMLNHPEAEAAYYDWTASVERITVERSRPDPKLTFEMYLADAITSLMPGLMVDLPGPGKLGVRAEAASAESRAKYFQFESSVLQTAFAVKKAYYPLSFINEKIRINRLQLASLADLEQLSRAKNRVGEAGLQDVLRAQIEQEKVRVEIGTLDHLRQLLRAQFKAALGLTADQPDPPSPMPEKPATENFDEEKLFAVAMASNPELKKMKAEVQAAEAGIRMAQKERVPDFTAGFEADVKASPVIWNPQFSMTLPVWRDKLAAELAAAQANKRAAEDRLTAQQISLALDFAERVHMVLETDLQLDSIRETQLPRAQQSLDAIRGAYLPGQASFQDIIDAYRTFLGLQLDEIDMQTQRETALAELSLIIGGIAPANAPLLKNPSKNP